MTFVDFLFIIISWYPNGKWHSKLKVTAATWLSLIALQSP